ncbi:MAG: YicC family protein [Eubacteriales bacterium]|jgi:uncharacterized protein (TIGR00255 family)|nr:YicC family protein [Eubacteriales bacterium]MDD4327473.1 YicC family protein [Eubacteriales bacterium]MDD4716778.1 YicC family protein [Eubacteriales bacterium]NCU26278.1 YicC family protein [Candidatus Nomurabacteria bacterium]
MARSMTGFGRGQAEQEDRRCVVEIRTVNSKYFDLQIKIPRVLFGIENRIRETAAAQINRGKTELYISFEDNSKDSKHVKCDIPLVFEYSKALREIASVVGSDETPRASVIARFNDVLTVSSGQIDDDRVWDFIAPAVSEALEGLLRMRETEGKSLCESIYEQLNELKSQHKYICDRAPKIAPEFEQKLRKRINDLTGDDISQSIDDQRLAMEVAVLADKCDIDEEITRLASHFDQFSTVMSERGSIGKKLDFLVQEMNREINTIGSKANDVTITRYVVEMKSLVEKIREQIQNIE